MSNDLLIAAVAMILVGALLSGCTSAQTDRLVEVEGDSTAEWVAATATVPAATPVAEVRATAWIETATPPATATVFVATNEEDDDTQMPVDVERRPALAATVTGESVIDWAGVIVSNPAGAQFDDYFEWQAAEGGRFGIDALDAEVREHIDAVRDTGKMVRIWGRLLRDVPDVNGLQIQATRLLASDTPAPTVSEDEVAGWSGTLVNLPRGGQVDDYFRRDDGEEFGIATLDDALSEQIETARWMGSTIQVWGLLRTNVPDHGNRQIEVERLEIVSEPATAMRNLSPFATASASSELPADRWGTYHAWAAIDGHEDTPWSEGVAGAGVGEWLMLTFPGEIEVREVRIDVGYDDEGEVFWRNHRIKQATLEFSDGTRLPLQFADERGMQAFPLVRAPGPNIHTTFVKLTIDEVYPGSYYDDTCLGELEVWGVVQ